jgi:protein tyrosine phosphatase
MVLDAISRGMKKIDSIAKVTKLSKDEVELIVNDLKNQKLINMVTKKGFFGNKKIEFHTSETGTRVLDSKKQELVNKSKYLQQLYETGNKGQMQTYMNDYRMWMPMMLFSGIMNMVMFSSMMSFMGMSMSPAESAQSEAQANDSGGSGAEDAGASSDTGDTGSFSDMGADSGMDMGGFDSF